MTEEQRRIPAPIVLPCADTPRVSVIILAWRHEQYLRECLASVAAAGVRSVPFEVVIVLNGATPSIIKLVDQEVTGARVVRSNVNLGFAGGCNRARREARGDFLLLLNDDAEVEPGWMEALVQALDEHPEAGAAGSRVLFTDGTVQEAGCVIWNDGSTATVGRGTADDEGRYGYLRSVDYCSACSLLVRVSTWDALGGLDEHYFPGYYEDVDLCLSMRRRGQKVLYQPGSRVRHRESASFDSTYKAFVFGRCRATFVDKWREVLLTLPPPGGPDALERAVQRARGPRRVLIVDDHLPDPMVGSGFGRMYETVLELTRAQWAVTVHPTGQTGDPSRLGTLGVEVVAGDLREHLAAPSSAYDAVIVSRPKNFARVADMIRTEQPAVALIYDAEAVYHRGIAHHLALAEEPGTRRRLQGELRDMIELEHTIAARADAIVMTSEHDAELFRVVPDHAPVTVRSALSWRPVPGSAPYDRRRDLLLVGGWRSGEDSPNADGLRWFARAVAPIVHAHLPWIRLLVTGAEPPAAVRSLAGPNVTFLGLVGDLSAAYDRTRVAVSPARFGAGVTLKTVGALEHGVPVVATTVGAEGIDEPVRAVIRVADDPRLFAHHVIELLQDRSAWEAQRDRILTVRGEAMLWPRPAWPALLTWALRLRHGLPTIDSVLTM